MDEVANSAVSNLIPLSQIKQLYLSHISNTGVGAVDVSSPFVQYSVKATIMLKDIHPLFEVMPISKRARNNDTWDRRRIVNNMR